MESFQWDSDDDDPIKLIDCEQKRINVNRTFVQECIEISDSDVDVVTVPPSRPAKPKNPAKKIASKIVGSTLPRTFFNISRNIKLLYQCLPLRIKVIDCDKHSWYYRKKYKNIKYEVNNRPVNIGKTINSGKSILDEEAMKFKIRPVDVESYLKSPIHEIKAALWKQNNDQFKIVSNETKAQGQNIDYKKNKGLVGLKIVYDVKKVDSNAVHESGEKTREAKTPASQCDSRSKESKLNQNEIHKTSQQKDSKKNDVDNTKNIQNIATSKSPTNHKKKQEKQIAKKSPALVDSNMFISQKSNKLKSDTVKGISKAPEEKKSDFNSSCQVYVSVESNKDIIKKKKCSKQITKNKTSAIDHKVHKETKDTESTKLDQSKLTNLKDTCKISQNKDLNKIQHEKVNLAKKDIKNKIFVGQKIDFTDALAKSQDGREIDAAQKIPLGKNKTSTTPKDNDKDKPGKLNITRSLQQNIDDDKSTQPVLHNKTTKVEKVGLNHQSVTRDPTVMNKQNIVGNKLRVFPIKEARKDSRLDGQHHSSVSMKNEGSFIIKDINDRNVDFKLSSLMPVGLKNKGQTNPKQLSGSMKTNVVKKTIEHTNEKNIDNKIANDSARSAMPFANKVVKGQSSDKATPRIPAPTKQAKSSEFQHNEEPHIHSSVHGKPEYQKNTQATNTQILPKIQADNSQTPSNEAVLGKQPMSNNSLLRLSRLPTYTHMPNQILTPISSHQVLPSSNPNLLRYQNSLPNVPLSKKSFKIVFPQDMLNKKLVSSTQQPRNPNTPNILNHSRINQIQDSGHHPMVSKNGKTLHLVPGLKTGRYLIKIVDNKIPEQQKINIPNKERHHQNALPNDNKNVMQNETTRDMPHKSHPTSNQYLTSNQPVSNQLLPPNQQMNTNQNEQYKQNSMHYFDRQPNNYNQNIFHTSLPNQPPQLNHNAPYYTSNTQQNADKVLADNHLQPALLSNSLPQDNHHVPYYTQNTQQNTDQASANHQFRANEYAPYYNENTQLTTNQVPWPNEQPKLNEYGMYYNNNTTLNTDQAPLPTQQLKQNVYEYYNQTMNSNQAPANQQSKANAHESSSNNNTILNLDTNTVMHPPPLYDYVSQNMYDTDCAYWNGVNYLGNEWQQGYPQPPAHLSPPISQPPPLPEATHYPPQPTVPQYQQPPPSEHPPPFSQYPLLPSQHPPPSAHHQPPSSQYPLSASQHQPPSSQYPSSTFKKTPPSLKQPPPSAQHPPPSSQHQPPSSQYPSSSFKKTPPSSKQPPPSAQYPPPSSQYPLPSSQHQPPSSQYPSSSFKKTPPSLKQPLPSAQHPPPACQYPSSSFKKTPTSTQHPPTSSQHPSVSFKKPLPYAQHPPRMSRPLTPSSQHPPPSSQHPPPTSQHPPPTSQHPPPTSQHPLPTSQHPPPTSQLPPRVSQQAPLTPLQNHTPNTFTQGSTILGTNNSGVVRTINLVTSSSTSNVTEPIVTSLNKPLTDADKISINTKSEMLQELSKTMDIESPNLKRSSDSQTLNGKPISGPLAKVRKMDGVSCDLSSTQKALNKGYSPPILPIPTYENTYEYLAQVSNSKETAPRNRNDAVVEKKYGQKLEGILKKKSEFDGSEGVDKTEKSVTKISIDEYKNRGAIQEEKVENVVIKTEIKTESKFNGYYTDFDTDLGYDSDSTVKL